MHRLGNALAQLEPGLGGLDVAGDLDVVEVDRVRTGAGGVGGHAVRAHGGITGVAGTDHPKPLGARLVGQDAAGQRVVAQDVDRKSVVEGKSVSVRVDLGGRSFIKKKKKKKYTS